MLHRWQDPFGWARPDLTPEEVEFGLLHARDPDRDVGEGRPVETVLAGFGDIERTVQCHRVIHAWRLGQGRTLEAMAGQITLAARLLAHNQVKRAEFLLKEVDPAQWPADRVGVIPVWLNLLRDQVQPGPVHKVYTSLAWRPWLNRTGPEGWAEGWALLPWAGRVALGPDLLPPSQTPVLPKASKGQPSPPVRMAQDVWTWQAQQGADVLAAIADQGQRLGAHWRTLPPPTAEQGTHIALWLKGLGLVSNPANSLLSSVEVVHRLYQAVPAVAEGHDRLRALTLDVSHRTAMIQAAWGTLPEGERFPAVSDDVLWRVLPGPRQIGNRPEQMEAVKQGWLHVLAAHPTWVRERPVPEAVSQDLATSRDPTLQAAWRQAQATAVTPDSPAHRRRWRT